MANKKRAHREKGAHTERTNRKPVEIKELIRKEKKVMDKGTNKTIMRS